MNLRRLRMGLTTVLGLSSHGFFIPYRYARAVGAAERRTFDAITETFSSLHNDFSVVIDLVDSYRAELIAIPGTGEPPSPRWLQDWFPGLDAAVLYALIRHHRPRRILEIGSGHSTRFGARAIADGDLSTTITAIDPAPRTAINGLSARILREPIQNVDPSEFGGIKAGDVVIIDSSHVLMPGSDVDVILNDILPRLEPGTLVHIHDVFLPDPYPEEWGWRGYNEQVAIAPLICRDGSYQTVFASCYARRALSDRLARSVVKELPRLDGAIESSLWLRKL